MCSGYYEHVGLLDADSVIPTEFYFSGMRYSPIEAISFKLTKGQVTYGRVNCYMIYREPVYISGPDCRGSLPNNIYWKGRLENAPYTLSALSVNLILALPDMDKTYADYGVECNGDGIKSLMPYICPSWNNGYFTFQGFVPGVRGMMCSFDSNSETKIISVTSELNGIVSTSVYDAAKPKVMNNISVTYLNSSNDRKFDFMWRNEVTGKYFVPNSNYTGIDRSILFYDWAGWRAHANAYLSTGFTLCEDAATLRYSFCTDPKNRDLTYVCGSYPPTVTLFTKEMRSELPSQYSVQSNGSALVLVPSITDEILSVRINYTSWFRLDDPVIQLVSYDWVCGSEIGEISYENSGNPGVYKLKYVLIDGRTLDVQYNFGSGDGSIKFIGNKVSSVCIDADCLPVNCKDSASSLIQSSDTGKWERNLFPFSTSPGFATFQVITVAVIGLLFIFGSVLLTKRLCFMRSAKWQHGTSKPLKTY